MVAQNDRGVELARSLKVTPGRKLRTDGTVVETNIHYPTVDALIADGVRLISPLVSRAKELIPHSVCQAAKAEPFRNRTPSAKRSAHKISKMALGRTQEAKATYRAAYQRLVEVARSSIKQAERVRSMLEVQMPSAAKISEEISHFAGLLKRAVWQTHPRVFEGEQLPATEKLLSIFESHTTIIRRGKARNKTGSLVGRCGSPRWMGPS